MILAAERFRFENTNTTGYVVPGHQTSEFEGKLDPKACQNLIYGNGRHLNLYCFGILGTNLTRSKMPTMHSAGGQFVDNWQIRYSVERFHLI